jgi:inner membrane protein
MTAAAARSEVPERMLVRPSFGNILLWRSIYLVDDEWQADAIRLGAPSVCIHPGERAPALQTGDADSRASAPPPTVTTVHGSRRVQPASSSTTRPGWLPVRDMRRLSRLTDDVMVIDAAQRWIGDGRYAMMPDSMKPIWGLRPADEGASAPVEWFTDRTLTPSMRARFLTMLLGTDPDCRER